MEINGNSGKPKTSSNGNRYSFDGFLIDPENRILERDGQIIPLPAKVFDVLVLLAEHPRRLIEKDELIEKVWRQEYVEEGNLARHVSTLRKALGDDGKERKYIVTVQGRGYRFVADVASYHNTEKSLARETSSNQLPEAIPLPIVASRVSRMWLWLIPALALIAAGFWFSRARLFPPANQIKSLAVLPLRSLDKDDNFTGAGIADAVIRKISQTGQLIVRPTSAILKYSKEDTDSLTAARQLTVDAVLEGNVQRADDRLRVSVNLLRTTDGASLWTDSFDMPASDIFVIEDKVAREIASRLELRFDSSQQAGKNGKYPTSLLAYEFYIKGVFSLDERGRTEEPMLQMNTTIDLFKKAIEIDPNFALAHAQLAFAYVWTAQSIEPANSKWVDLAREEIKLSQELGPNLAETHLANALFLWGPYAGYQNEAAVRELLVAKELNPNSGHGELPALYGHIGLDELAKSELQRDMNIDPTSQSLQDLTMLLPFFRGDADEWFVARQKLYPTAGRPGSWYFLRKGNLEEAHKAIDDQLAREPDSYDVLMQQALLLALKGDLRSAEGRVPGILARIQLNEQDRHHSTYIAACIYALARNSTEAVKWLKETAATGFPNYPLFERDPFLNRIRQSPEFLQFMADQKAQWEKYRQEFGNE